MNFAGKSVGWHPLDQRVRIKKRSINSLGRCSEHSVKSDRIRVVCCHSFLLLGFHSYEELGVRFGTSLSVNEHNSPRVELENRLWAAPTQKSAILAALGPAKQRRCVGGN
jgi:hypothetical protein